MPEIFENYFLSLSITVTLSHSQRRYPGSTIPLDLLQTMLGFFIYSCLLEEGLKNAA